MHEKKQFKEHDKEQILAFVDRTYSILFSFAASQRPEDTVPDKPLFVPGDHAFYLTRFISLKTALGNYGVFGVRCVYF